MRHTIYMLLCCLCTFTVAMAQASQRYKRQGEYKVDFPFHFTEGDKRGLIQELLDLY